MATDIMMDRVLYVVFLSAIFLLGYVIALQSISSRPSQVTERCVDGRVLIKFGDRKALEIHPTTREFIECG